ncbi:MAG: polymorphic toxin type 37 domain-containing protein [Ktedonobacteraceae bacterium]
MRTISGRGLLLLLLVIVAILAFFALIKQPLPLKITNPPAGLDINMAHISDLPIDAGKVVVGGCIYIPPKSGHGSEVRNPEGNGFVDARGNVWQWAQDQHGGPHWDVQHANGTHTNGAPDGKVIGKDNYPNSDSLKKDATTP